MSSINEVCAWCNIAVPTFHDAVSRGVISKQPRGQYDIQAVARALIKDAQARKAGKGDYASNMDLSKERARLARQQTEAVALKNAATRGDLIPVSVVKRSAGIIVAAFRERVLSIPGKIAAACEMRSRGEIEEIVRDEIHEALDELSRPILIDPAHGGNEDAVVAADDEAE
jgi:phage terminase Nu1 subunit (DNA packaging protein)